MKNISNSDQGYSSYDYSSMFEFPDSDPSFDQMMEQIATTTTTAAPTTTKTQTEPQSTTTVEAVVDERLRIQNPPVRDPVISDAQTGFQLDRRRPSFSTISQESNIFGIEKEKFDPIMIQRSGSNTFNTCLKCDGQTTAACKSTNLKQACIGKDDVCLVQIRTRFSGDESKIFSRCVPRDVCKNHESQNFIGADARFFQCRANVAERWSRGSICNFCHKMGKSDGNELLFNTNDKKIEIGDGSSNNELDLDSILANPRKYLDGSNPTDYIFDSQTWVL